MKLKGISAVEQHFEKAVVGTVGLVFLGVLGLQFLTQPNLVTVGKSASPVPPGEAYKPVEEAARSLQGRLEAAAGQALIPEEPKFDLLSQYRQKIQAGVTPRPQLSMLGPRTNLGTAGPTTARAKGDTTVAMAPVPAPSAPAVCSYAATIDPLDVLRNKQLKSVLPPEQPYDKQWVTIEATFDGTALKTALDTDPDGDGPARPVPHGWYDSGLEIVGVQMERQKLSGDSMAAAINGQIDAAGESWSEPTLVPPMPGSQDVVADMVAGVKNMTDLAASLSKARENRETLMRPEFLTTIAGPKWLPPTEARQTEATTAGKNPMDVINDKIAAEERKKKALERKLNEPTTSRRDTSAPETGGGGKSGGGGAAAPEAPRGNPKRDAQRHQQTQSQIDLINKKIAELNKQKDDLTKGPTGRNQPSERRDLKAMLADPAIRLWAHDVTAEPGAVYRYRTRVVINNPMFGRSGLGDEAGAKLPVVLGQWSEWTDPVLVLPSEVYFVSSATPRNQASGMVTAGAECYVFYYGYYRRGSATLEPGDVIHATAKTPANLMIYDEEKLAAGGNNPNRALPNSRVPEQRDTSAPESQPGPGKSGVPAPQEAEPAPTSRKDGPVDDMNGLLKPAKKEIPIFIQDIFLDAVKLPELTAAKLLGTAGADESAVFRTAGGRLTTRLPSVERGSPLYKQIAVSFEQGKTQGQPKPEEKKPEVERPRREERPRPAEDGSGGGGGGG